MGRLAAGFALNFPLVLSFVVVVAIIMMTIIGMDDGDDINKLSVMMVTASNLTMMMM